MFEAGVTPAGGAAEWLGPFFDALKDPSKMPTALSAIDEAFSDPATDSRINVIVRTALGDTDGAMKVAMALANSDAFSEVDFLFAPELRPLREHPQFRTLMKKLGVADYWEANRCVWEDDRVHCPS